MAEIVHASNYAFCAGRGCRWKGKRTKVKVPHRANGKKVLCRDCWHKMAEEAAKNRYTWTHIAYSDGEHEMFYADELELFIEQYELEEMN